MLTLKERFMSHVKKTNLGCWLWSASKDKDGYGWASLNRKSIHAHRLSWILSHGEIPKNAQIHHLCNRPACVNPNHLQPGTNKENTLYSIKCGRHKNPPHGNGLNNPYKAKLSEEQVKEIRYKYSLGTTTHRNLAKEYKISYSIIGNILNNKDWAHLI